MQSYKNPDKTYLEDQPEISAVIRSWLSDCIDLNGDYAGGEIEDLECKSRDGFIPASHNCGGFEKTYMTDLRWFHGTGHGCGEFDSEIDKATEFWLKEATEHCTKENITEDEARYEVEDSYLDETVWLGVRCMYEGIDNGTHTLMVYCSGNISQYYGPCDKGSKTLREFEIKFRTVSGLQRRLKAITNKVLNAFGEGK